MKISSITNPKNEQVYNLRMAGNSHNYVLTNGTVSKNSHSISYAALCYVTTYLRLYAPAAYMAALMSLSDKEKMRMYLRECERLGISVRLPSIGDSGRYFTVASENEILFGLGAIDGLGTAAIKYLEVKPKNGFYSMYDFFRNSHPDSVNKKVLEHLVWSGSMDKFGTAHKDVLNTKEKLDLLTLERKNLGFFMSGHPLNEIQDKFKGKITHQISGLGEVAGVKKAIAKVGGYLSGLEIKTTKKGATMATAHIEDLTGSIELTFFPSMYEKIKGKLQNNSFFIVMGRVETDDYNTEFGEDDEPVLKLMPFDLEEIVLDESDYENFMVIRSKSTNVTSGVLKEIENLIEYSAGNHFVYLDYMIDKRTVRFRFRKPAGIEIKPKIEALLRGEN